MVPRCEKNLLATRCVKSKYDDVIFYWHKKHPARYSICTFWWLCWTGIKIFQNIINHIRNVFTVSKGEWHPFKYLGLNISQTNHESFMYQKEYIEETEAVETDKSNQRDHNLLPHKNQQLWRLAEKPNWVSTTARPDMVYAAGVVSSSIKGT